LIKFLSEQWFEKSKKIASEELDPEKDLNRTSTSLMNIINNVPPDGKTFYFYILVNEGNILEMKLDRNSSIMEKDVEFIVSGNYDTFKQIFKGDMGITIALIKNRIEIKGDKKKALKLIKPLERVIASLREITDEY
jgi:putative sterol carrier protein